jgi:hypothetical protein
MRFNGLTIMRPYFNINANNPALPINLHNEADKYARPAMRYPGLNYYIGLNLYMTSES